MTGILRAVLSISAATVLSRVTGYARTMVQAAVLGTAIVADAYAYAVLLPTLIYELFLGGILYSIFIPVLVDRITRHGEDDARRLTDALFTFILPLMALATLLGIVFAEPLVSLTSDWEAAREVSPEQARETSELAVFFFRIFALQMLFYGVTTIATGVLQAHRHFFLPTFTPVLNNLIIIGSFGGFWLVREANPTAALYLLAGGVSFGVAIMALALVPTMFALGYRPRPRLRHPALLPTAKLAGPMVILVAASVGFQLFGAYLASGYGAVAELGYAFTIFSLPYGIFVVAIATAMMPELSEKHSREDHEGYRETFSSGLRMLSFVVVPSAIGMATLAGPVVGLLYERGEFGPQDTAVVAALLAVYATGLLGYSAYFYLVRAFYSRQNTATPAALNVGIFLLYAALAYGLARLYGAEGIVLALSAAYAVLALAALAATRREIKGVEGRRLLISLARMLVAGAAMYAVARGGTALLGTGSGSLDRLAIIAVVGTASLAAYLAVAYALRSEELGPAVALFKRRFARKRN